MSSVVDRFIRFCKVDSQSDPNNFEETPSTTCQREMAQVLELELKQLGMEEVERDEHAYVTASLPASAGAEGLPALGLIAHLDTAPGAPASGVAPHIVHYEGGDLKVGEIDGKPVVVSPEDVADLASFEGQDIVCSDGTTLLGADDKAGVAEICELIARLKADPSLPHPRLKVAFVPDEEIGHGASLLELHDFGATWAYTVDGEVLGEVSYETFNAAEASVVVNGTVAHPGSAKGIMVNALEVFCEFNQMLPAWERPEHTEGYEGYYHLFEMSGDVGHVEAKLILRDFFEDGMDVRKQTVVDAAALLNARYGEGTVMVEIHDEYQNMASALADKMFLVDNALEANRMAGIEARVAEVRGGTDGSQLTLRGLPCPNLATGGYGAHSEREFIPVSSMERTVDMLVALVGLFAVPQK